MIKEEINPKIYFYKFQLLSYQIHISVEKGKYLCEKMHFIKIQVFCISIQIDIIRFTPFSGSSHCIVLISSSFNNLVTLCSCNH